MFSVQQLVSRRRTGEGTLREGMLEGFSLGSYLLLVDYTSRLDSPGALGTPSFGTMLASQRSVYSLGLGDSAVAVVQQGAPHSLCGTSTSGRVSFEKA